MNDLEWTQVICKRKYVIHPYFSLSGGYGLIVKAKDLTTLILINVAGSCLANSGIRITNRNQGEAMSVESKALADKVVSSFQNLLDSNAREAVGDSNFHALHVMIREAIAVQSEALLDRLRQNLKQIESEIVDRTPLEL